MKKRQILSAFVLLFAGHVSLIAQELSVIAGQWVDAPKQDKELNLYAIRNGACERLASSTLAPDGRFAFAFYPEKEGYYAVGTHPQSKVNRYVFYFKPGDDVQFRIEGDTWKLTGENTPENRELEKWHNLVQPLEGMAVYFMGKNKTYVDYFPLLTQTLPQVNTYPKAQTPNAAFNESFEAFKQYNFLDINLNFLNTPRSAHPKATDYISYYRALDIPALTSSLRLLDYPDAMCLIESSAYTLLRGDTTLTEMQKSEKSRSMSDCLMGDDSPVKNDTLKGELTLYYAAWKKDYATIDLFREQYADRLVTDDQQRRFNAMVGKLDDHSQGHAAIDFKFPDATGREVALSDFKGKVVYIDIWATWCGPCKGEIPHMAKLEEEFKDCADMVFLSVSIDKAKDKQKWLDMLKEKQMKGVQLFAGDRADDISGPYKVRGIPRFILVGKDGRIISGDAPRPSSTEIRPLLKKALSAK